MVQFRDVIYKQDKRFSEKVDRTKTIKGVIVDSLGNDSGSGDIWADRLSRRVWVRELGTAGSSQVICYNIEPVIGLGVILGYEIGSNTREVLRTDKEFLGPTNPTGTSYESPSLTDFLPGGRFALWVASKMISPLSTYPSSTGLSVNVVAGDYPYAGTRKTFAGQTGIALTQNPNSGQHYYAGLYLDSLNSLQVVYGASVVLATTPPEPAWPAGAFRLSVVRVNDTQTSITLAQDTDTTNDIRDRRMPWSDEATHNLLSATHPDTLTGSVVAGDIVYGNSTPKWARLPKGSDGQVLTLASGLPSWAAGGSGTAASQATVDAGTNTTEFVNPSTLANAGFHGKYSKNLLYHSIMYADWTGANDVANDTYINDTVWNHVNNGQAPDITAQAASSTDPLKQYLRCTFDSASSQAGIVQFLKSSDSVPYRGEKLSISADLWGTNITTLRMAVLEWQGTADAVTSDVVATWGAGDPTLAANWVYLGTPAAITITTGRARYEVENLTVGIGANNLALFIWTDAVEASGDLFNVARTQMERGPVATDFVARGGERREGPG